MKIARRDRTNFCPGPRRATQSIKPRTRRPRVCAAPKRDAEAVAFQSANSLALQGFSRAQETGQAAMAAVYRQSILDKYLMEQLEKLPVALSAA